MKSRKPIMSIFLLIAITTFCSPSYSTGQQRPFTLTISGPETIASGDPVPLRAVFKNVSGHKLEVVQGGEYTLIIHDDRGKEITRLYLESDGSVSPIVIDPGESIVDFGRNLQGLPPLMNPGIYVLQLTRRVEYANPKSPIIESNEIKITVVSRKQRVD